MHPWWFAHIIIFFWWWYLAIFFQALSQYCAMCQFVLLPHFFYLNMAYCSISLHLLSLRNALSPSTSLLLNYSLLFSFHLLHCSSIVHSSLSLFIIFVLYSFSSSSYLQFIIGFTCFHWHFLQLLVWHSLNFVFHLCTLHFSTS